jgi:hypothetical protein
MMLTSSSAVLGSMSLITTISGEASPTFGYANANLNHYPYFFTN